MVIAANSSPVTFALSNASAYDSNARTSDARWAVPRSRANSRPRTRTHLLTSHARQRSSGADGSAARSAGVSGVPRLDALLGVVASPAIDGVGVVVVVVPARVALGPRRDRRRAVLGVVAARASELDVGVRSPARDGLNMTCAARACGARARGSARVPGDADIAGSPSERSSPWARSIRSRKPSDATDLSFAHFDTRVAREASCRPRPRAGTGCCRRSAREGPRRCARFSTHRARRASRSRVVERSSFSRLF